MSHAGHKRDCQQRKISSGRVVGNPEVGQLFPRDAVARERSPSRRKNSILKNLAGALQTEAVTYKLSVRP